MAQNEEELEIEAVIGSGCEFSDAETTASSEQEDKRANDPACAFCDDGGNVLYCDGNCMRSFHIGMDADEDKMTFTPETCNPLGLQKDLARKFEGSTDPFLCPNCLASEQQCFACKKLGSSDEARPLDEQRVVRCAMFECGRFYHPRCIDSSQQTRDIVCPLHNCGSESCKVGPSSEEELVPCKRCPTAFHLTCIPQELLDTMEQESGVRVWLFEKDETGNTVSGVDRSLLYCSKHELLEGAATPPLEEPLFNDKLLADWRMHYSKMYRDLPSSVEWLKARLPSNPANQRSVVESPRRQAGSAAKKEREMLPSPHRSTRLTVVQQPPAELRQSGLHLRLQTAPASSLATGQSPVHLPLLPAIPPPESQRKRKLLRKHDGRPVVAEEAVDRDDAAPPDGGEATSLKEAEEPGSRGGRGEAVAQAAEEEMSGDEPHEDENKPYLKRVYWSKEAVKLRLEKLFEGVQHISVESVRRVTRMPEPYSMPGKRTVTEERMQELRRVFRLADELPEMRHKLITANVVKELSGHEDNMRLVLAPFLHAERYSSYGRHFTKTELLDYVSRKLQVFAQNGDTVADFSCGSNEFVPMFKRECLRYGKLVRGKAFDIITPRIVEDFELSSWFDVTPGALPPGEQLIIGLNPPYGKNNILAERFMLHAVKFWPRIIVLIVPPSTLIPQGYQVLLEDTKTMSDRSFYIPGLMEEEKEQWNVMTPSFRILARQDLYPLSDQVHVAELYSASFQFFFPQPVQPAFAAPGPADMFFRGQGW